jgi:imidazolonepropionase-like amidohydrolase
MPPDVLAAAVSEAHRLGLPITAHAHAVQAIADAVRAGVDGIEHASFWTLSGVNARPKLIEAITAAGIVVGATIGMRPIAGLAPPPEVARRLPALQGVLRALYDAGALLVAGTDAGIAPIKPPDAVRYAAAAFQQLGMSAPEALRAVTSGAALALGLGHRKGQLAPGFDADILAVDGDPLVDVEALHRIRAVLCRGRLVTTRPAGVPTN